MAYVGTTSTAANPPKMVMQTMGSTFGGGWRQWVYVSTHISSDLNDANFFTDAVELGMQVADGLIHVTSTGGIITSHSVLVVGATTTDVSVGTTIGLGS